MRPDDNVGSRQAHAPPDAASRSHLAADPALTLTPRSSIQARDSSLTYDANNFFSHSSASIGLTAHTRTDSLPHEENYRDSFVSIVDDPFFQRYDPALEAGAPLTGSNESLTFVGQETHREDHQRLADDQDIAEAHYDSDDNVLNQRRPPPRRESLIVGYTPFWWYFEDDDGMESYNIAVIGSTGVGKSSFVQGVLGLSRPPISNASTVRMLVDNTNYGITLLELDLEYFELSPTQPIQWPKQINGHIVPRVDAALILYDVLNQESIRELPQTLAALTNSGLPAALVACKCENPESQWEVDAEEMANHKLFRSCIATFKNTPEKPEIARNCLHTIIRAAIARRREENGETFSRRRAQSAANLEAPDTIGGRPTSQHSKHSRASSDFSLLRGFPNPPVDSYRAQSSRSPRMGQQPQHAAKDSGSTSDSGDQGVQTVNSMLRTPGIRLDKPSSDSPFDMEGAADEAYRYSDDIPILQRPEEGLLDRNKVVGVTFDELVDRLLAPRLSRADNNFSDIFLCLYRKFAAPGELFSAILTRLDRVREDRTAHYLSKTATQLRIIEEVAKWVSLYPGDFARPATRRNLEEFIKHLSTEPIFSIAAQHMRRNLQFNVVEDDDTGWANSDENSDQIATEILMKDMNDGISTLSFDEDGDEKGSSIGSHSQFHSYDEYEKEAALLEPTATLPLNKFRYHIFMDISDDDIADELTRIDWIMFSSIRIRDFVRHVSLSASEKEKCKSLKNVNRMINHFNHVAQWVANMILLRDKAKHRAQVMDKFMCIALKLRQLNNYNGLAAVLAGINGTAIHRLAQTRTLVPAETQKRFARLVILMGTQKSHFAYRLAWENSPLPRIPFIPLHRRDLVSAEEGSKTFVGAQGDRINWKKFEVLGEVLLPIMKSQGTAYPNLARHDTARELILGCRMSTDDEEIYQRSVHVEGSNVGGSMMEPAKKKFNWFTNK